MSPARKQRLYLLIAALVCCAASVALALTAFESNLTFFYTPSEITAGKVPVGTTFRVGGLVEDGSLVRTEGELVISFAITDTVNSTKVSYQGLLPDLFKEGQGVVVKGKLAAGGVFVADEVLAKHDENYLPVEAAAAIDAAKTLEQ